MNSITPLHSTENLTSRPYYQGNTERWAEVTEDITGGKRLVAHVRTEDKTGEANLALFMAAPKIHDLVHTMLSKMESILYDETAKVEGPVRDEIQDIINEAWEVLNEDGNLLGIAEYHRQED